MERFPLIDVYPIIEPPHDFNTLQLREFEIKNGLTDEPLPATVQIHNAIEFVEHSINNFDNRSISNAFDCAVNDSVSYKSCKKLMPNLGSVPNLCKYRKTPKISNNILVNDEINQYGRLLSQNQIVFHGGVWVCNAQSSVVGTSFLTDSPLSTSLCAQVAAVHATYHEPNEIWIVRISQNIKTKSFIFSNDSRQKHSKEKEVVFASGATVICLSEKRIGKFRILEVELF